MVRELVLRLSRWEMVDTWIALTGALAAMACALPGNFLLLRRQSMMGDALSHTALPGIVLALLAARKLQQLGWLDAASDTVIEHQLLFAGALAVGLLTAVLTESVRQWGNVESSAALGVVFTSLFAVGLVLIRVAADSIHIDPDCVLYGTVETAWMKTWGNTAVPEAVVYNAGVFILNALLVALFYKELQVSTFDPALADTLGIPSRLMHYGVMTVTAATVVSAFESVGSILVIAMLIVPPATAYLLTGHLRNMLLLSVAVAGASAVLGHALAIAVPAVVFRRLGFDSVQDASTAGMMAVAAGLLFFAALLLAPQDGIVSQAWHRWRLALRIAREDLLGWLYRQEEGGGPAPVAAVVPGGPVSGRLLHALARWQLRAAGLVAGGNGAIRLTDRGRDAAREIVRSHRLWESYMSRHFPLPEDHLHDAAARVEHFIDAALREQLSDELQSPTRDPHGREIPRAEKSAERCD